jgi:Asp-tRNA(Asn)/Glu-tRNA(Gln) amidotransferase A subunit family amidase
LRLVDVKVELPGLGLEWVLSNMASVLVDLGDSYPDREADLTPEIAFGINLARDQFNLEMAAVVEKNRTDANETMAALFDEVDFVISATNPDIAYPAEVTLNTRVGEMVVGPENNGALTIPANIYGNPSVSIPIPTVENLPVGLQVMGRHHEDALLLDLALIVERERPWPLVAPGSPR